MSRPASKASSKISTSRKGSDAGSARASPVGSKPSSPAVGSRPPSDTPGSKHSSKQASKTGTPTKVGTPKGGTPKSVTPKLGTPTRSGSQGSLASQGSASGGSLTKTNGSKSGSRVASRTESPAASKPPTPPVAESIDDRRISTISKSTKDDTCPEPMSNSGDQAFSDPPLSRDGFNDDDDDAEMTIGGDLDEAGGGFQTSIADQDNETEDLVVLDPDHPLMRRFQQALSKHLNELNEKIELEGREVSETLRKKKNEKEELGVELYGLQQELARIQMNLESLHDQYADVSDTRQKQANALDATRHQYKKTQCDVYTEKKRGADLMQQVENYSLKLFYMTNAKEDVRSDIAVMRRVAEKAEVDTGKIDVEKKEQDLFLNRLVERVDKLREEIAMLEAEIAAQNMEASEAKTALREASAEIEGIMVEKRQLFSQWNSALIGMRRRDEAHAAMNEALNMQSQEILSADTKIDAIKKSISKEQEQNEKFTLIANKWENEIASAQKQIKQCDSRMEALRKEFSTSMAILTETERNLNIANAEKTLKMQEVDGLRKEIERAFRTKVELEDAIMEVIRQQDMTDKSAKYSNRLTMRLQQRSRGLEQQQQTVFNAIAEHELELAAVGSETASLRKLADELTREINERNQVISKSQLEITKRTNKIEQKQNQIDQYNKKLQVLISKSGGEELGPMEMTIKSLGRSIQQKTMETQELQQHWLRQQTELVHLSTERDEKSKAVSAMKRELMIATQRKIRVEREIEAHQRDIDALQRSIKNLHNEITKLDTLIYKETGNKTHLEKNNRLLENDFVLELKEKELSSLELQDKLDNLKKEKERLLENLVEAERQIMLWEKKTQIAKETRAAVDSDIGQGEMKAMQAEIHRMQVRFSQLMRQQETLVREMETTVSRRETIVTRGEAATKKDKEAMTKANFNRQLNETKKKIKQIMAESDATDAQISQLRNEQSYLAQQLQERDESVRAVQTEAETIEEDIQYLMDKKHRNLAELMSRQQKGKWLQQVKDGKYTRLCKNDEAIEAEMEKQNEQMQSIASVVQKINVEVPHLQPLLYNVTSALNTRLGRDCTPPASSMRE